MGKPGIISDNVWAPQANHMRIFDVPCGCAARKEIMFTKGHLGVPEAAIVTAIAISLLLAWKVHK